MVWEVPPLGWRGGSLLWDGERGAFSGMVGESVFNDSSGLFSIQILVVAWRSLLLKQYEWQKGTCSRSWKVCP